MKAIVFVFLLALFVLAMGMLSPVSVQAQFGRPWVPAFPPFNPWYYANPFLFYPMGYFGFPVLPPLAVTPYLVEPGLRIANAPVTLTIPTVSTITPPLTAIFNLLDPTLLSSNIAVLTTNFPLVFDLLVTTFQLPLL